MLLLLLTANSTVQTPAQSQPPLLAMVLTIGAILLRRPKFHPAKSRCSALVGIQIGGTSAR